MASRTIVFITGGNNGIGYETVRALMQSSKAYEVLMGSRSTEKATAAIDTLRKELPDTKSAVQPVKVDLDHDESIQNAFHHVKASYDRIDVLINNGGATFDIEHIRGNVTLRESFTKAYNANLAGTHVLTHTFMPLLLKSQDPRLLFTAGLANQVQAAEKYFPTPDLPPGWPKEIQFETIGYRCSKTALNMLMLDWNHKLKADGVKVWSVAPGFLATDLGGMRHMAKELGAGDASAGGQMLRSVVEGERDADVGKIVNKNGISMW